MRESPGTARPGRCGAEPGSRSRRRVPRPGLVHPAALALSPEPHYRDHPGRPGASRTRGDWTTTGWCRGRGPNECTMGWGDGPPGWCWPVASSQLEGQLPRSGRWPLHRPRPRSRHQPRHLVPMEARRLSARRAGIAGGRVTPESRASLLRFAAVALHREVQSRWQSDPTTAALREGDAKSREASAWSRSSPDVSIRGTASRWPNGP